MIINTKRTFFNIIPIILFIFFFPQIFAKSKEGPNVACKGLNGENDYVLMPLSKCEKLAKEWEDCMGQLNSINEKKMAKKCKNFLAKYPNEITIEALPVSPHKELPSDTLPQDIPVPQGTQIPPVVQSPGGP